MEKIEINYKDEITQMENVIEKMVIELEITKKGILISSLAKQKELAYIIEKEKTIFVLTILSILYKQKNYEEYIGKKIGQIDKKTIKELDKMLYELKRDLDENPYQILQTLHKYNDSIREHLLAYFYRKNKNYILEKNDLEIIRNQKKEKEFLKLNPLNLNQLVYYNENPLTEEEKIIAQVNLYYDEAEQTFEEISKQLNYIKNLLEKNNTEQELDEIILFIIRNTYQEIAEDKSNEKRKEIMFVIENEKIKPSDLISFFKYNKKFSNMFLENFIYYNMDIDEGRLEELKQRESQAKVKRLYKN